MKLRYLAGLGVLAAVFVLGGCQSKDDETFDGTYVGDGVDSQSSSNRKEFTLRISGGSPNVSGTYQIKAILVDTSGGVTGTLTGSDLSLTLTPAAGVNDCPYRITGTWAGDRITGSYAAFNCFVRSDGTISLKKK